MSEGKKWNKKIDTFKLQPSICLKMITWKQVAASPWVAHLWKSTDSKAEMCSETRGDKGYGQRKEQLWLALSLGEPLCSYTKLRWSCPHVASWGDRAVLWDASPCDLKRHARRLSYALQRKDKAFTFSSVMHEARKATRMEEMNYKANTHTKIRWKCKFNESFTNASF